MACAPARLVYYIGTHTKQSDQEMEKKPYKTGGAVVTDGNGNVLKFTRSQVLKRIKAVQKRLGLAGCITDYFVTDRGEYWTASAGIKTKSFY